MYPVKIDEIVVDGEVYLKIAPQAIVLPVQCPHCHHKWETHFWLEDFKLNKLNNQVLQSLWFVHCPNCKKNLPDVTLMAKFSVEVTQEVILADN